MTKRYYFCIPLAAALFSLAACRSSYQVAGVERTRILIDSTYDSSIPDDAKALLLPYSQEVEKITSPVMGRLARPMRGHRPESPLSNLLADILVHQSRHYNEHPDFGVYNMGGIRAGLPQGEITFGQIMEVAPFSNKICFLTLKGKDVTALFQQMARVGGEGVSHGVELRMTKDKRLISARLHGKEIVADKDYRIVTIDYLAEGNDKMTAFKQKFNFNAPASQENDARFIIADYFKEQQTKGIVIDAQIEGRTIIE